MLRVDEFERDFSNVKRFGYTEKDKEKKIYLNNNVMGWVIILQMIGYLQSVCLSKNEGNGNSFKSLYEDSKIVGDRR